MGGKLIQYHGFADPVVPPLDSINYRQRVLDTQRSELQQAAGKPVDEAQAELEMGHFYRLFMVPGMAHCSGGPGANSFTMQTALEAWVEHGTAPTRITAAKHVDDNPAADVAFTRPLCVYPAHAFYVSGDDTRAESYECRVDALRRSTPMPARTYLR